MQIFEFHFNPKLKLDLAFNSFCYEPENIYEQKVGSLYIVGLLKNVLPQNIRLIDRLAGVIKNEYFKAMAFTPEKSLKESLKVANEFLREITKKGNVGWLGNLSFAILSLKNFKLNFTKLGDIKILLIRAGKIIDIDKKIKLEDVDPYPLKIFGSTVSGKLTENDLILVLTKDIFDFLQRQDLLNEIAKLSPFNDKGLKDILNGKKESLVKISGVLLSIILTKEDVSGKKETISTKELKEFSLKEVFAPIFKFLEEVKKPSISIKKPDGKLKLPKIKIPQIKIFTNVKTFFIKKIKLLLLNKKLVLVSSLIVFLSLGFLFSQYEQRQKIKTYRVDLERIQEKLNLAESFLILKETNPQSLQETNRLLKESWDEISLLSKEVLNLPNSFTNQVLILKDEISKKLVELNKLEEIEEPELFFEFNRKEFIPQKILVSGNNIYLFTPYSQNIFFLNENKEKEIIKTEEKINLATKFNSSISFFSKPDKLIIVKNNNLTQTSLQIPYPDFNFSYLSSYKSNLYFFDKKTGQIVKYPFLGDKHWDTPKLWLTSKTTKPLGVDSFTVDGSIWALKENTIYEYYAGEFQRKIELEIFPQIKDFSKIYTSPTLPYLYILEPIQKRIVILDKTGKIIKQFQSEKFDNLLDFGVSEDGKTIWLLNGLKVYQIKWLD